MTTYIINKKGNVEIGNEQKGGFKRFAKLEDVEKYSKTSNTPLSELLEKADVLSWIKTTKQVAKGTKETPGFIGYAEKAEVVKANGNTEGAELRIDEKPGKEQKPKQK